MEAHEIIVLFIIIGGGFFFIYLFNSGQEEKDIERSSSENSIEKNTFSDNTLVEIQNTSYSDVQNILKQMRKMDGVNQLSYEFAESTGTIVVQHDGSSHDLLEKLYSTHPDIEIVRVTKGHIIIKLIA